MPRRITRPFQTVGVTEATRRQVAFSARTGEEPSMPATRHSCRRGLGCAAQPGRGRTAPSPGRSGRGGSAARRSQASIPPVTLNTSVRPDRIRKPVTAADRTRSAHDQQRPVGRDLSIRVASADVGRSMAPGARNSTNSFISRTSSRTGWAGSSRSRRSASATSTDRHRAGLGHGALLGSSGGPRVGRVGVGREIGEPQVDRVDQLRRRPATASATGRGRSSSASTRRARAPVRFRAIPAGLPRTPWT